MATSDHNPTRRVLLGHAMVAMPLAVTPVSAAFALRLPKISDRDLLDAYDEWLRFERDAIAKEIHPELAERGFLVHLGGLGAGWHDRPGTPPPSTRAASVLRAVGVLGAYGRA